jgi:hypothetical protein
MSRGAGGGRPSKADLAERTRRKKAWARQQEHHRQRQARIKAGLVEVIPIEEAVKRYFAGTLKGDLIVTDEHYALLYALLSPVQQLLAKKLQRLRPQQLDDAAMRRILLEVLVETPYEELRRAVADTVERLAARLPEQRKRDEACAKLQVIKWCLAECERRGMMAADAREVVAGQHGFPSSEALRKFIEKNARLLDDAT